MLPEVEINYLAVFLAAVSSMVVGSIWYSPLVFGKPWMKLVGLKQEAAMGKSAMLSYLGAFITALIMAFVLSHFAEYIGADELSDGLQLGFWAWLGFIFTSHFTHHFFANRPFTLFLIDMGHSLVEILVMSLIIVGLA